MFATANEASTFWGFSGTPYSLRPSLNYMAMEDSESVLQTTGTTEAQVKTKSPSASAKYTFSLSRPPMVLVMAGYLAFLKDPSVLSKPVMWHVWPCCSEQTGVPLFWPGPMHSLHTGIHILANLDGILVNSTLLGNLKQLLCFELFFELWNPPPPILPHFRCLPVLHTRAPDLPSTPKHQSQTHHYPQLAMSTNNLLEGHTSLPERTLYAHWRTLRRSRRMAIRCR